MLVAIHALFFPKYAFVECQSLPQAKFKGLDTENIEVDRDVNVTRICQVLNRFVCIQFCILHHCLKCHNFASKFLDY